MFKLMIMSLLAILASTSLTLASAIPADISVRHAIPENYTLGVARFVGTIGDYEVDLNGTVQQVLAQFQALYPEFNVAAHVASSKRSFEKRNKDGILCIPVPGQDWDKAWNINTAGNIDLLNSFQGGASVAPKQCVWMACADPGDIIMLCNDNDYEIAPSYPYLASYAHDITQHCGFLWSGGQEFDSDSYNVIVKRTGGIC